MRISESLSFFIWQGANSSSKRRIFSFDKARALFNETPFFLVWQSAIHFLQEQLESFLPPSLKKCGLRGPDGTNHGLLITLPLVVLLAAIMLFPRPAAALPPSRLLLDYPPTLIFADNTLSMTLAVTVDDEEGLREMLKDGAVLELMLTVTIERERSWWANVVVFSHTYPYVIRHDPLSRDFIVNFTDKNQKRELRDRNLTRLLHESWKNLSLYIMPLNTLNMVEGTNYRLNFSITLRHIEVPPWLEKNLLFWSAEVTPPENGSILILSPRQ